jgi:hypothetical protein
MDDLWLHHVTSIYGNPWKPPKKSPWKPRNSLVSELKKPRHCRATLVVIRSDGIENQVKASVMLFHPWAMFLAAEPKNMNICDEKTKKTFEEIQGI